MSHYRSKKSDKGTATQESKRYSLRDYIGDVIYESKPYIRPVMAGVLLKLAVSLSTSLDHPGPELLLTERVPVTWVIPDCPSDWKDGKPADPVALAKAFRSLSKPIHQERIDTGLPEDLQGLRNPRGSSREERLHSAGLMLADYMLDGAMLDTPSKVSCENMNGDPVTSNAAESALTSLGWAGRQTDTMTGVVSTLN